MVDIVYIDVVVNVLPKLALLRGVSFGTAWLWSGEDIARGKATVNCDKSEFNCRKIRPCSSPNLSA